MSEERIRLITVLWAWDRLALVQGKPPEFRRGLWRILDALYDDMPIVRMPGYREDLRRVLAGMRQTEGVVAVRKELGVEG